MVTNQVRGEKHPQAKLCFAKVQDIRTKLKNGVTQKQISLEYGISQSQVSRIKSGMYWK